MVFKYFERAGIVVLAFVAAFVFAGCVNIEDISFPGFGEPGHTVVAGTDGTANPETVPFVLDTDGSDEFRCAYTMQINSATEVSLSQIVVHGSGTRPADVTIDLSGVANAPRPSDTRPLVGAAPAALSTPWETSPFNGLGGRYNPSGLWIIYLNSIPGAACMENEVGPISLAWNVVG